MTDPHPPRPGRKPARPAAKKPARTLRAVQAAKAAAKPAGEREARGSQRPAPAAAGPARGAGDARRTASAPRPDVRGDSRAGRPAAAPQVAPAESPAPGAERAQARNLTVSEDRAGQRLDNFLLGQLKGAPRSLVYKLVRSGQVRVNGGRAKAERKLEAGDEVRVPPLRVAEEGEKAMPPAAYMARLEAAIVFEDARLLALNKPSGVASHGGSGISFGAIETLRALRPGQTLELVHRLDRDTSGLLIVAKKRSALTELQALMREGDSEEGRGIAKRYLTLLVGRLPDGVMTVDAPLHVGLRQGGERHVQVRPEGKPSLSHFRVLERRGGHSYCEVRIETGRTHQIRVHAQHLGHPVAGDDKYGEEAVNKRLRDQAGLRRLFLHAASLEFALDGGQTPYVLNAPLAPELAEVLERLG